MKKINILFTFAVVLSVGCMDHARIRTGMEGKPLPAFNLLLTKNTAWLNTASIASGQPIVMVCISPQCPYCRAEIKDIVSNISKFQNVQFYFLANYSLKEMKGLSERFGLQNYPNITVAIDTADYFTHYFPVRQIPFTAIYDPQKKLKQVLIGKSGASTIKDIVYQ